VIEVEVHSSLRDFIREQERSNWPHHLTMARLVARAFRLGRSALIQTGTSVRQYCLSYLTPILLGDWSVILVTPRSVQKYLLEVEIPELKNWLKSDKLIQTEADWLREGRVRGLLLLSPEVWLTEKLNTTQKLPDRILTIIDRADELEEYTRDRSTIRIESQNWDEQIEIAPQHSETIREARVKLTLASWQHPANPYQCYLLEQSERQVLEELLTTLAATNSLSEKMKQFSHCWFKQWENSQSHQKNIDNRIIWATLARDTQQFTLNISPISVAQILHPLWQQQPVVLIGSFLDRSDNATIYRQNIGLEEILCLKFSPNRQTEHIQLYLPDRFPLPNTPEFQGFLIERSRTLIELSSKTDKPTVLLVGDVPLKAQVGTALAAEFGSRVRVETTDLAENGILISGWEFWRSHQEQLPIPQLLIIATLPFPSLENPMVAARVAYYKRQRQDWFRLYLLPVALRELQQAILPLREAQSIDSNNKNRRWLMGDRLSSNVVTDNCGETPQSIVALLDNRVNHRSYGSEVLAALEPCARINYIDPSWFNLV
jgi:ATP-dependent DNA helicase DinG